MKRAVVILILALVFSLIALYFLKPGFVEKIWLWIVGLLGAIIAFFQNSGKWARQQFPNLFGKESAAFIHESKSKKDAVMEIVRYSRSGNRIFGLVYIENEFVGISNENATNRLGIYDLDIKDHTITFSNESFSSSILPAGQIDATGKSVFIAVDQNNRAISNDQIYNGIVEKLAHLLEMEKQPKLQIYNQVDSKK
jgi:hypothetical protein